jgi:hypothetical protein
MKKSHITTNKRMSGKKLPMALGCCSGAASSAKAAMEERVTRSAESFMIIPVWGELILQV